MRRDDLGILGETFSGLTSVSTVEPGGLPGRLAALIAVQPDETERVPGIGGCWLWTGNHRSRNGYGRLWYEGRLVQAHRFVYQVYVGSVGPRVVLDHECRNRPCVRPSHLTPRSGRANTLRGVGPTAQNAAKVRCSRGHDLTDTANVRVARGRRSCKKCEAIRDRVRSIRRKAKRSDHGKDKVDED